MKLKEKIKRFLTLDVHGHEGFTLVELIIVIAILAILSSVAVVGYSSYVAKANKAADEQLLRIINQAFRSACIDNGVDVDAIDTATIELTDEKKVDMESVEPYGEVFAKYYANNVNDAFKVMEGIVFDALLHQFVDMASASINVCYNGFYFTVSGDTLVKLKNSTFGEIGSKELLAEVATASKICYGILVEGSDSSLAQLVYSDAYMSALAESLNMTSAELGTYLFGMTPEDRTEFISNSLVLTAAGATRNLDAEELLAGLQAGTITASVDTVDNVAETAAIFALYTAYTGGTGKASLSEMNAELQNPESGFRAYIAENGAQDLEAYMAAMGVVDDAGEDPDAAESIIENGFDNDELEALLGSLMGG